MASAKEATRDDIGAKYVRDDPGATAEHEAAETRRPRNNRRGLAELVDFADLALSACFSAKACGPSAQRPLLKPVQRRARLGDQRVGRRHRSLVVATVFKLLRLVSHTSARSLVHQSSPFSWCRSNSLVDSLLFCRFLKSSRVSLLDYFCLVL